MPSLPSPLRPFQIIILVLLSLAPPSICEAGHGMRIGHQRRSLSDLRHHHAIARRTEYHGEPNRDTSKGNPKDNPKLPAGFDPLFGIKPGSMRMNGVYLGFIVEGVDASISKINKDLKHSSAAYGRYAQVNPWETFTGRWQLLNMIDDIKESGAVFQPALMIEGGYGGLTWKDNHQAVAIAKCMAKFTDAGIPVMLRLDHEMNWYLKTGLYAGNKENFKEAWAVVADAMRKIAPAVKMFWSLNVSLKNEMKDYAEFEPDNFDSTVDVVGIDWYPTSKEEATTENFLGHMKKFHDRYASETRPFVLGEAGLHFAADHEERVTWLERITKAKEQMPHFLSLSWYNCDKEFDYKLVGPGLDTNTLREKLT